MAPQNGTTGKTIQSVGIALEILEVLRYRGTAGVTELAAAIDRSKSTGILPLNRPREDEDNVSNGFQ